MDTNGLARPAETPSLLPAYASHNLILSLGEAVLGGRAKATQFMGHTDYQLTHLIINDREHPNDHAKYRQLCRELWARIEAAIQNRNTYLRSQIEADLHQASLNLWAGWFNPVALIRWALARRRGLMALKRVEIQTRRAIGAQLQLDFDERILRESKVLYDMLTAVPASTASSALEEQEAWQMRARLDPKVRELMR